MREYCLEELFELQMGKTPSRNNPQYWNNGNNDWISIGDLSGFDKYVGETKEQLTDLAVTESGIKEIPPNTVVMSFKLSIGKLAITTEKVYSNEAIMAFIDKKVKQISPDYLYYLLLSKDWNEGTNKAVMGITLNKATLSKVKIKLHNFKEQEQIVSVLDKSSKLITLRKLQMEELDNLIKSRFVEIFGDVIHSTENVVELKEIADIGSSKRIYANEYTTDGIPFYRSKEIRELGDGNRPSIELFISEDRYNEIKSAYGVPAKGDILIAAIGATIGYMWVIDTDAPFYYKDGNLILISNIKDGNSVFFQEVLKQLIGEYKRLGATGSAQLALTIEKVEKFKVPVPDMNLQNQFAAFVQQVDKLKVEAQKSLDEMQVLFNSLMQKYFG